MRRAQQARGCAPALWANSPPHVQERGTPFPAVPRSGAEGWRRRHPPGCWRMKACRKEAAARLGAEGWRHAGEGRSCPRSQRHGPSCSASASPARQRAHAQEQAEAQTRKRQRAACRRQRQRRQQETQTRKWQRSARRRLEQRRRQETQTRKRREKKEAPRQLQAKRVVGQRRPAAPTTADSAAACRCGEGRVQLVERSPTAESR